MITPPRQDSPSLASALARGPGPTERAGFSLLEMLVASAVLAVGLVIVTESISAGLTASTSVDRLFHAGQLAADRLNRAAAGEYATLPHEGKRRFEGVEYRWRLEEGDSQGGLRLVLCNVQWTSRGRRHMVTLGRRLLLEQDGGHAR